MSIQLIQGNQITIDDIREAVYLDGLSYDKCYRGNLDLCMTWFRKNPGIYDMIRNLNNRHIIAYTSVIPVTSACYRKIRSGEMIDTKITADMITENGDYVYLSSIVIHPDWRSFLICKTLLRAVDTKLASLQPKKILADAVSESGKRLCRLLGMRSIGPTTHGSELFEKS